MKISIRGKLFALLIVVCTAATQQNINAVGQAAAKPKASGAKIACIEVTSNDACVNLLFDFTRSIVVKPSYCETTRTLSLVFPQEVRPQDLKTHQNWSQIANLSKKGLTVELDEHQKENAGAILRLQFPKSGDSDENSSHKNKFVAKWSNVDDIQWSNPEKNGNRFTVNVFSKHALEKLKHGPASTTVVLATNDVVQNDFSSMAGLAKKSSRKRIIIDAGHGGADHGARGCGNICEKEIALQVSKRLINQLKAAGHQVHLTRSEDQNVPLIKRCNLANQLKADAFISIHLNSGGKIGSPSAGIETYYLTKSGILPPSHVGGYFFVNTEKDQSLIDTINKYVKNKVVASKALATCVQSQVIDTLRENDYEPKDRGVKEDHLRLLLHNNVPTTLIEIGFVTNPDESAKLQTPAYQNMLAAGITRGLQQYFDQQ